MSQPGCSRNQQRAKSRPILFTACPRPTPECFCLPFLVLTIPTPPATTRCTPPFAPSLHAPEPFFLQFRALERQARQQRQLIILDECDRLLAWGDDFMQRLFALPFCKGSQLVLIGIANAGSLLYYHSQLYFCNASTQLTSCRPSYRRCSSRAARLPQYTSIRNPPAILNSMFVVFSLNDPTPSSYTSHQIHQLLHCRLSLAAPSCGRAGIFEERALDFCARKCAGLTGGDFRRCLDFCRHALAASLQRQQQQGGSALAHVSSSFVFITVHNCNMSSRLAWLT